MVFFSVRVLQSFTNNGINTQASKGSESLVNG